MRQLQKKLKSGSLNVKEDDPFELFIAATDIRYCYYTETHKILGNTYGMCVLQASGASLVTIGVSPDHVFTSIGMGVSLSTGL
jgi:tRNA(Met) C34 N-acetyltransferase TmcA